MSISLLSSPRKRAVITFLAVFALLMLRSCAFGLAYFPQLDDYIQYHNYLGASSFSALCQGVGLLASRPLAGVADYFFWGRLFSHMILGVALISLMYTACALMTQKLLRRYFQAGPIFLVVMCLLPLGMEGLYWMSASTRIVSGLFFGCLAAVSFAAWLDTGRWYCAALYLPLQLLPFGFYEQSAVLSMTLVLGMALLERGKHPRRVSLAAWALVSMALYFVLIKQLAGSGVYGSRTEVVLPITPYYWRVFLPQVLEQLRDAFIKGGVLTMVKGFLRGLALIPTPSMLLWLLCVLLSAGGFVLVQRCSFPSEDAAPRFSPLMAMFAGFLLFLAPITPFLLLANPWFSLRGTVTSFAGLALFADALAQLSLGRLRHGWCAPSAWLAGALAVVCSIASLSELKDYQDTHENDHRVAQAILETVQDLPSDTKVGVLNIEPSGLADQNFLYHEHITGCTESSWALSGLLTYLVGEEHPSVTPLPAQPMYRAWNSEVNRPENFQAIFYYDGTQLRPVHLERTGEHDFLVYEGEALLGIIWEDENQNGYFELSAS